MKALTAKQALLDIGYTPQADAMALAVQLGDEPEAGRLLIAAVRHLQRERDDHRAAEAATDAAFRRVGKSFGVATV